MRTHKNKQSQRHILLHGNQDKMAPKLSESHWVFEDVDWNPLEDKEGRYILVSSFWHVGKQQ